MKFHCATCKKKIPIQASQCGYCGHPYAPGAGQLYRKQEIIRGVKVASISIFFSILFGLLFYNVSLMAYFK